MLGLVVWLAAGIPCLLAESHKADVVVLHGRVYTENSGQPWAEAVAIEGGMIVAVGNDKAIERWKGAQTREIDAQGHLVLPGFVDCHIHFLEGSEVLGWVQVNEAKTLAEVQEQIRKFAAAHPEKKWILGRGWTYPIFGAAAVPHKKFLDTVVPDRPVYIEGFDGHTSWVNSKALAEAGFTKNTPDPPNGTIVRDPQTGEPTGALKEGADDLFKTRIPPPTREEKVAAFRAGLKEANRAGLVRVHGASELTALDDDLLNIDLLDGLRRSGELTVRMYLAYQVSPPGVTEKQLQTMEDLRRRYHDEWLSGGVVKFFMDGVVESHTAAMIAPYSDDPKLTGTRFWQPDDYNQAVAELDKRSFQIFTHAIGDLGVRTALDGYEYAARTNHTSDARHRIEHIENVSAADIPRFGKLGVIASFQPLHAYPDEDTDDVWLRNVGPERAQRAWAWGSIARAGGALAFGSDWPVVTLNPWEGLQMAVTRQTREATPKEGFVPGERISVADAIRAYTLGAAYAGRREKTEGSIAAGKVADLIIVSQDIFKIDPHDLAKTEVLLTMVGGRVVYRSAAWPEKAALQGARGAGK
jgi:predicted amidohydrolase YtcJ